MAFDHGNRFLVGMLADDDRVHILGLTPRKLVREEALNLAAWLLSIADAPLAFEHVAVTTDVVDDPERRSVTAVLSAEFVELLGRVQLS